MLSKLTINTNFGLDFGPPGPMRNAIKLYVTGILELFTHLLGHFLSLQTELYHTAQERDKTCKQILLSRLLEQRDIYSNYQPR